MKRPDLIYYARLEYDKESGKTPKYTITAQAGDYPPMEALRGKDGRISMFLLEKLSDKSNTPAMRLQAKGSLNFTGIKELFTERGGAVGYAYGNPMEDRTYSSKHKRNPFYEYRQDGFLLLSHYDKGTTHNGAVVPDCFELAVVKGGKQMIASYCKMLQMGEFDGELEELRRQAGQQQM